jgi:hypothetical protein
MLRADSKGRWFAHGIIIAIFDDPTNRHRYADDDEVDYPSMS